MSQLQALLPSLAANTFLTQKSSSSSVEERTFPLQCKLRLGRGEKGQLSTTPPIIFQGVDEIMLRKAGITLLSEKNRLKGITITTKETGDKDPTTSHLPISQNVDYLIVHLRELQRIEIRIVHKPDRSSDSSYAIERASVSDHTFSPGNTSRANIEVGLEGVTLNQLKQNGIYHNSCEGTIVLEKRSPQKGLRIGSETYYLPLDVEAIKFVGKGSSIEVRLIHSQEVAGQSKVTWEETLLVLDSKRTNAIRRNRWHL